MVRVLDVLFVSRSVGSLLVIVVPEMKLSPNVGSDRSWVWNVVADVSEGEPEALTLAIRFANSDNANQFKDAFIKAQKENESVFKKSEEEDEEKKEEVTEEEKKEETA
jgi:Ran-binding protein 1